jgi:hypothetical protein
MLNTYDSLEHSSSRKPFPKGKPLCVPAKINLGKKPPVKTNIRQLVNRFEELSAVKRGIDLRVVRAAYDSQRADEWTGYGPPKNDMRAELAAAQKMIAVEEKRNERVDQGKGKGKILKDWVEDSVQRMSRRTKERLTGSGKSSIRGSNLGSGSEVTSVKTTSVRSRLNDSKDTASIKTSMGSPSKGTKDEKKVDTLQARRLRLKNSPLWSRIKLFEGGQESLAKYHVPRPPPRKLVKRAPIHT